MLIIQSYKLLYLISRLSFNTYTGLYRDVSDLFLEINAYRTNQFGRLHRALFSDFCIFNIDDLSVFPSVI